MPIKSASLLVCMFMMSGCMLGPNYQKPSPAQAGMPDAWHARLPHDGELGQLARWWSQFDDAALTTLIETAEKNNPTIAKAVGSVREARANVIIQRASLFPSLTGDASITRAKGSSSAAAGGSAAANSGFASSSEQTTQSATLDASWEIDLFGKIRRNVEASKANLAASESSWHDARVTLAAEVANAYVNRRQCELLVNVYETELVSTGETNRLTTLKVQAGFNPPSDQAQTEASVAESESKLETQKTSCAQYLNQLVALSGLSYPAVEQLLTSHPAEIPVPRPTSLASIPVETIEQRPDVAVSERQLQAASANIGVAITERLPSVTLSGSIGVTSYNSVSSDSWSFGPSLSLPIFDAGSKAANVESMRAKYDQALATYRASVLTAVQEVEDALVRVDAINRREISAARAENRYSTYFASVEQKYKLGAASLLDLEQVRRTLLSSREQLAAAKLERSASWIALYKAAGGGWQLPARQVAVEPARLQTVTTSK